jgi:hypothetical protein
MKKYVKAQVVAKNNPQGSYAAGCPAKSGNNQSSVCKSCETTK